MTTYLQTNTPHQKLLLHLKDCLESMMRNSNRLQLKNMDASYLYCVKEGQKQVLFVYHVDSKHTKPQDKVKEFHYNCTTKDISPVNSSLSKDDLDGLLKAAAMNQSTILFIGKNEAEAADFASKISMSKPLISFTTQDHLRLQNDFKNERLNLGVKTIEFACLSQE